LIGITVCIYKKASSWIFCGVDENSRLVWNFVLCCCWVGKWLWL